MLNNQLWTAEKGLSSLWCVGRGLTFIYLKEKACFEMLLKASDVDEFRIMS
jgi:hypothetical protein